MVDRSKDNRRLAAIVFTDVVGFTKLTAKDQNRASDLLDTQRNILKPLVESYPIFDTLLEEKEFLKLKQKMGFN